MLTPNVLWVDLKDVDFSADAQVKKLQLHGGEVYAGHALRNFIATEPFAFRGI
ncbi:hypothetical protein J2T57_004148 [Natronocella acetinitrilica]|uniref:Uncharacterized protein n=1 Tax=Natronocella acetinitrilica TaxID=414046 RepID=A0AAE3G7A0_9GAMM|nr:hypothetical protein [Natronocella acetinitrilica]MCP1676974.1 hypothetical protein [Natronocella acetinitrilica]